MAEKINDGGPVFPCEIGTTSKGMTLRDYLAAKAMDAYKMADAMLKARGQQ